MNFARDDYKEIYINDYMKIQKEIKLTGYLKQKQKQQKRMWIGFNEEILRETG